MGPSQSKTNKKAPVGEVTSQDRAILDLKNSRDRLKRYIAVLDVDEKRLLDRAKEMHQQGKKRQAVLLMKVRKKKIKEAEVSERAEYSSITYSSNNSNPHNARSLAALASPRMSKPNS